MAKATVLFFRNWNIVTFETSRTGDNTFEKIKKKHFWDSKKMPQSGRKLCKTESVLPEKRLARPKDLEECKKNWNQFRENVGTTLRTISETQQVLKNFNIL